MKSVDMGEPSSDPFRSRFWYPLEYVTFMPGRRFSISSFDILIEEDSVVSMFTVKDPAGSVPEGN
jgi:hypothetical protein